MRIIVTGAARGIGRAAALKYLSLGHEVHGIDIQPSGIDAPLYVHHVADIRDREALPDIEGAAILFNNAGVQQGEGDIETNLVGAINVTEKYIERNDALRSILFNASASSVSGQEFPYYVASKAGLVGYMRNVAIRVAPRGVTCNAISLGGVLTDSNDLVMRDPGPVEGHHGRHAHEEVDHAGRGLRVGGVPDPHQPLHVRPEPAHRQRRDAPEPHLRLAGVQRIKNTGLSQNETAPFQCGRRDLNPYGLPHAPQTCAYAYSATTA